MNFLGMKNVVFFESKSWWKDYIYWLLKSICFELFGDGKYGLFWVKKLVEKMNLFWTFCWWKYDLFFELKSWWKMIFTVTEKFLFWTFWWWEIRLFFSAKKLMERWYLLSLFELSLIFQDLRHTVFRAVK